MAKSTKMSDFRTLNLEEETTPTKKSVGAVSANKNRTRKNTASRGSQKTQTKKVQKEEILEEEKPRKTGIGLAIFFLLLVLVGAFVGCMFTPAFNVTEIHIQDGTYVAKEEILSKMDGVMGENILRVNTSSLENAIKEMPYIRSVEIKRNFPSSIDVTFKERKPYALVKYLESYVVMDKRGYVLEIKKENDLPDLAIIYGINADEYIVGKKLEDVVGLKYENITYLLETAYQGDFDYTIYEINYADSESLVMAVKELDVDINFGEVDRSVLTEKMNYLNGILKKLEGKKGNLDISSNNYLEKTIFTERY
ncbi:MAG: FtsQ-type POTRA domain-containing protein [Clostridia bacterium]|nr:FtsQ-type POTRA domain-containing protein [Clostridia bacterium]